MITNIERMVGILVTDEVAGAVAAIFGVADPSAAQVTALRNAVAQLWPEWEAAINQQRQIHTGAIHIYQNLLVLADDIQAGNENDPRQDAVFGAIQALNAAWGHENMPLPPGGV